jgi:hypothetical protein
MKEARLEIVLPEKEKKAFAKACKKNFRTMSSALRELMNTYTQTHK